MVCTNTHSLRRRHHQTGSTQVGWLRGSIILGVWQLRDSNVILDDRAFSIRWLRGGNIILGGNVFSVRWLRGNNIILGARVFPTYVWWLRRVS